MDASDFAYGPAKKLHAVKCLRKEPCILNLYIGFGELVDEFTMRDNK